MSAGGLRSSQFRHEREAAWRRLEGLVERCDRDGIRRLSADEIVELSTLYQHAVGSLATSRVITLDRNVVDYLESLVARAHLCVYGYRERPWQAVRDFARQGFPRTVRRWRWHVAAAAFVLAVTIASGSWIVARDESRYYALVSLDRASGRTPMATTEALAKTLYDSHPAIEFELERFATALFTHNAQVGLLCAALGVAGGLPIPPLLAFTGLELGAMAELFRSRGLGPDFWAWILPHGVTELLAVVLCAAAGLATGFAFLFPGTRSRREATAAAGRDAGTLVIGAMGMFVIAAAIEGVFRQRVTAMGVRWAVAIALACFWAAYFALAGRGRRPHAR